MTPNRYLRRWWCALGFGTLLLVADSRAIVAQEPVPWTGIVGDEAAQAAGAFAGFSVVHPRALSGDARFLVFESDRTLVAGDTNGVHDVFLRDRHTGQLQRVSLGTDGMEGDFHSVSPSISANGRHVVFSSLAANFDPTDTNHFPDVYLRDLDAATTTLISVGPNGEQGAPVNSIRARVSGDGRFVVFTANFGTVEGEAAWLRDRDADGNGVFDEPGTATTTLISVQSVGASDDQIAWVDAVAVSNDARYIAYSASTFDGTNTSIGFRVFLHDRLLDTTVRVDVPLPTSGDVEAFSRDPDFSDAGELVYTSTAPNLVPGDADAFSDVFVYDIATASQVRLQLTHRTAEFTEAFGAAISSDGRYVAFTGYEIGPGSEDIYNVYAIDRLSQASYDVNVRTDGSRDNASLGASISADGGSIAFMGSPSIMQEGILVGGVYVATSLALSPADIDVPTGGGTFAVDITVPMDIAWTARLITGIRHDYVELATYTGVGPATVDVEIPFNDTGENVTYHLWLGSEEVTFDQGGAPIVYAVYPDQGPAAGGTPFELSGFGFKAGATVTFDGVPAADLVVDEYGYFITGITPPHPAGAAPVVVTNPGGAASVDELYFFYLDDTPPIITSTVTGPSGANGWYVGDVSVEWSVQDDESQIYGVDCENVTLATDGATRVFRCQASSEGGDASAEVGIKRDATAPTIAIQQPEAAVYAQGQNVALGFTCVDATSGISTCTANQSGNLQTGTPGTFDFTVTATDAAGNQSTSTVSYTVQALATLDAFPASGTYGGAATLRAVLVTADGPLADRTVTFYLDGVAAATATTIDNGAAHVTVSLAGRHAGTLALRAEFAGDATALAATSNTTALTIARTPLRVVAVNSTKVYGQALPAFTAFGEGFVSGEGFASLAGSLTFTTPASAASAPGTYAVTPSGVTSPDYTITFVSGTLTVTRAATALALNASPSPNHPSQNVLMTATVAPVAPGAGVPTGTVEFRDNGVALGSSPLVNGVATLTKKLKKGNHTLTATYTGNANFTGSSASRAHQTN
jgi:Tol biopolymer transport system component